MTLLGRMQAILVFFIIHFEKSFLVEFNLLLVKGQLIFVCLLDFTNFFLKLWNSLRVLCARVIVCIQAVNTFQEVLKLVIKHD